MNSDDDLECAYFCCTEVLNTRRLHGSKIPQWLKDYHARLDANWAEMSANGRESCSRAHESQTLGVEEVAAMLNISPRQVRRLARTDPKLGGRTISGAWMFDRAPVEHYARTRKAS